jgi:hypothetical protein
MGAVGWVAIHLNVLFLEKFKEIGSVVGAMAIHD